MSKTWWRRRSWPWFEAGVDSNAFDDHSGPGSNCRLGWQCHITQCDANTNANADAHANATRQHKPNDSALFCWRLRFLHCLMWRFACVEFWRLRLVFSLNWRSCFVMVPHCARLARDAFFHVPLSPGSLQGGSTPPPLCPRLARRQHNACCHLDDRKKEATIGTVKVVKKT